MWPVTPPPRSRRKRLPEQAADPHMTGWYGPTKQSAKACPSCHHLAAHTNCATNCPTCELTDPDPEDEDL
jgi:hypothetical protein